MDNEKNRLQNFKITGMTCGNCVKKITQQLQAIAGVSKVNVDLRYKKAEITADRKIDINEIESALASMPKYQVQPYVETVPVAASQPEKKSLMQTYKPLIVVFTFVFLIAFAVQIARGEFNSHLFMNHIMAGFFLGLSFFKVLDVKAFAEAFSIYDPIAKRFSFYGRVYPFIEVLLGLLFVSGLALQFANIVTILVLSLTTYGVIQQLKSKSKFQCACLGAGFNLPLSGVTVFENVIMILMAAWGLYV